MDMSYVCESDTILQTTVFNTRRVIEWKVQLYVLEPKLFLELKLAF